MKLLFLITARGGSKGIPGKNIKPFCGKPLLYYSIDTARTLAADEDICLSTDDEEIKRLAEAYKLHIPFMRPNELATDQAGSYGVIMHAIEFYEQQGKHFDAVVLLQPTSPFRTAQHVKEAIALYSGDIDMVVSVNESSVNPYYNLFEENSSGYLELSKKSDLIRRQDAPKAYVYNGAVYVMSIASLKKIPLNQFTKVKKYIMKEEDSIDLDTPLDWEVAEYLAKKRGFGV